MLLGRAVFADREAASLAPRDTHCHALNDNVQSGDGPSLMEILYLRRGLGQPGGKLDWGEPGRTCAEREIREELGIGIVAVTP